MTSRWRQSNRLATAEATRRGHLVVSIDPLYRFSREEIATRVAETFPVVLEQTRANAEDFLWERHGSVEQLGALRRQAMDTFLADYPAGRGEGRYLTGELPGLPFDDSTFDLALSSHLLFLYGEQLSRDFHLAAVRELSRVAAEVRIFPLIELSGQPSRHLSPVQSQLHASGYQTKIVTVNYQFQRGGNRMLIIRPPLKERKEGEGP